MIAQERQEIAPGYGVMSKRVMRWNLKRARVARVQTYKGSVERQGLSSEARSLRPSPKAVRRH